MHNCTKDARSGVIIWRSCAGACVALPNPVSNDLPAVSGTIEIDALEAVSGEIDERPSGRRFPRPRLQYYSGPFGVATLEPRDPPRIPSGSQSLDRRR